jgi:hypothetical protein
METNQKQQLKLLSQPIGMMNAFLGNLVEIDIPSTQFTQHGLKSVLTLTPRTPADFGKVVTVTYPIYASVSKYHFE